MESAHESHENTPISPDVVIEALRDIGIEDQEVGELLARYAHQCQAEADTEAATHPGNPRVSNRANIRAAIKMAAIYVHSGRYADYGIESLEQLLEVASQDPEDDDLVREIKQFISILKY